MEIWHFLLLLEILEPQVNDIFLYTAVSFFHVCIFKISDAVQAMNAKQHIKQIGHHNMFLAFGKKILSIPYLHAL